MLAIISDIHSNIEALTAVLEDIDRRGATKIVCLGDVIGYGPNPQDCLDLVSQRAELTLMGNHDYAVLYEPNKFNIGAESACYWTRAQLESERDTQRRNRWWDFIGSLPVKQTLDGSEFGLGELTFVHGSPRRPVNEYVFPDDIYNAPTKVQGSFDRFSKICFIGHTHVPGVFFETPDFYSPDELEGVFEPDENHKALVNVGSVGQPRDRDPRASYLAIKDGKIEFVRVEYDIDTICEKVRAIDDLDDYLGTRLKDGR